MIKRAWIVLSVGWMLIFFGALAMFTQPGELAGADLWFALLVGFGPFLAFWPLRCILFYVLGWRPLYAGGKERK